MLFRSAAALICFVATSSARAQYRLDSGDVVDISIFGRSELQRRATVNSEGSIALPLIGEVQVRGLQLADVRARIAELFSPNDSMRPNDVLIEVVEARPFYVVGDVLRPGPYPWRSGLTVLHAVAVGGGMLRGVTDRLGGGADLGARLAGLRSEYARHQVRIAGLSAEIANRSDIDLERLRAALPGQRVEQLVELENRALATTQTERDQERTYLRRAIELANAQIIALENGEREEVDSARQQVAELQRVTDLNRRGLANASRVSDEQRAASLLKSRQMDTSARLARARQEREDLRRRLERADERAVRAPRELQDALLSLESVRAQMGALALQIEARALQPVEAPPSPIDYEIRRDSAAGASWISATEDTLIQPGDLIRVSRRFAEGETATGAVR